MRQELDTAVFVPPEQNSCGHSGILCTFWWGFSGSGKIFHGFCRNDIATNRRVTSVFCRGLL